MKRATYKGVLEEFIEKNFNPRPREEGDCCINIAIQQAIDFNPRPREEGDLKIGVKSNKIVISIHALVKRATVIITKKVGANCDFNPRPREEGDKDTQQ